MPAAERALRKSVTSAGLSPKSRSHKAGPTSPPSFRPTPRGFLEEAFSAHPGLQDNPSSSAGNLPPLAWSALGSLKAPSLIIYIKAPRYSTEILFLTLSS
jgi:hypothetical protein